MTTAKTTPTEEYLEAGRDQAQGDAKIDTVAGKIQKAEGVAKAQIEPNIDMNDVRNVAE